jgi:hypothetical protein
MLDETQAPAAETDDDAVDLAALGGEVETADEPAVTAEQLMEIPDAPEVRGPDESTTEARAREASDLGAQAAAEDASAGGSGSAE